MASNNSQMQEDRDGMDERKPSGQLGNYQENLFHFLVYPDQSLYVIHPNNNYLEVLI
jgi:hypothetical protein